MWTRHENHLEATLKFTDFKSAFAFMTRVAFEAERMQHHPTWTNTYNTLQIKLSTHDAGDTITEKDEKLAKVIETLYAS